MTKRLWHPESHAEAYLLWRLSVDADVVAFAQQEVDRAAEAMLSAAPDDLHERQMYAKCARDIRDALKGAANTYVEFRDAQAQSAPVPQSGGFT